jgi:DNA mismatch repair protein MutS
MAGMPPQMLKRANEILAVLENNLSKEKNAKNIKTAPKEEYQLSIFQLDDPVLQSIKEELINIDINTLTPVEALMKLNEIKKMVGG